MFETVIVSSLLAGAASLGRARESEFEVTSYVSYLSRQGRSAARWLTTPEDDDINLEIRRTPASDTGHALAQIRRMYTWGENWDGEGAPKPSRAALRSATEILGLLSYHPLTFSVMLDSESRPLFNVRNSEYDGYIVIEDAGKLSYYFRNEVDETLSGYDLDFSRRHLPEHLVEVLSKL